MIAPLQIVDLPVRYLGERWQAAYVVKDLDEALRYWTEVLKVGPFVRIDTSRGTRKILYRGTETQADYSVAFAYWGDVQIEIVNQVNDEPSIFKEFLDTGREGLQHICYWPDDMDTACSQLEASGFVERTSVVHADGTRDIVYYDPPSHLGTMIEIVRMNDDRRAYFGRIESLARSWDGVTRPVRRFADRAAFLASGEGSRG